MLAAGAGLSIVLALILRRAGRGRAAQRRAHGKIDKHPSWAAAQGMVRCQNR